MKKNETNDQVVNEVNTSPESGKRAVKKDRKIVATIPQLCLFTQQPDALRREALFFLDGMPGISFEQAVKLAMYNAGLAEHPVYHEESVEDLIEQTRPAQTYAAHDPSASRI